MLIRLFKDISFSPDIVLVVLKKYIIGYLKPIVIDIILHLYTRKEKYTTDLLPRCELPFVLYPVQ